MPKRLKVLISAYACEPNKGSEPEVGWQWSLQMAKHHDVSVLTRANNRDSIETELALMGGRQPVPEFIYHDEDREWLWLKKRFKAVRVYYVLWQISASRIVEALQEIHHFDVIHHVTFAGFRYRTAIWNHGAPTVWGPVGGVESIPWRLLPWKHPASLIPEILRNLNNFIQSAPFHVLPKRAQTTTVTLVSTEEMEQTFLNLGLEATLMPTIGLQIQPMKPRSVRKEPEPLRVLFVGNIITLKGIDLAIEAFAQSGVNATFTIVGSGKFGEAAKRLVRRLGLEQKIIFRGRFTREETLRIYPDYDLFLFPSLHDTGGYALIEAMSCGLPVICLDCGGPRVAVGNGAGTRVPLGSRRSVIRGLADALRKYDENRERVLEEGLAAREIIVRDYDWNKKGEQLDAVYQEAAAQKAALQSAHGKTAARSVRNLFNRLFPVRGLVVSTMILFIIGTIGFLSLDYLRRNAELIVKNTMPSLSEAGTANSTLAEAFNRTLLMLMADTPAERAQYRKELDTFNQRTTQALATYERTKLTPEEAEVYNEVLKHRDHYLAVRSDVLILLDEEKIAQARALCEKEMLPAYFAYKTAAEKLLKFNAQQGETRGKTILVVCTVTQYVVAGAGILLFVIGFTIGLLR